MKYTLYNTDNMTKKIVDGSVLYGTLLELQEKGAIFSLDIDNEITYSFEDEFEGESIDVIMEMATGESEIKRRKRK